MDKGDEGVSRTDANPALWHPDFQEKLGIQVVDDDVAMPTNAAPAPRAQAAAAQTPAQPSATTQHPTVADYIHAQNTGQIELDDATETEVEGEEPSSFRGPTAQVAPVASDPASLAAQSAAQAVQAAASVIQSAERLAAAVDARLNAASAPAERPVDPRVEALAERVSVDPRELETLLRDMARQEANAGLQEAANDIRAATKQQRETNDKVTAAMREAGAADFSMPTLNAFLSENPDARFIYETGLAVDPVRAARLAWAQRDAAVPAEERAASDGTKAPAAPRRAPAQGARAATSLGGGRRVPQTSPEDEAKAKYDKLWEMAKDLPDNHPLAKDLATARFFPQFWQGPVENPVQTTHGSRFARGMQKR